MIFSIEAAALSRGTAAAITSWISFSVGQQFGHVLTIYATTELAGWVKQGDTTT